MKSDNESAQVSLDVCITMLRAFPCFNALNQIQIEALAFLLQEIKFKKGEQIVAENDLVDSIYLIVKGEAEVTHSVKEGKKIVNVPLARLFVGEGIGLIDTGFYSKTGKRTATVTANTDMLLLRLDINDLYDFLKTNALEDAMYAASLQMQRMRFIKLSLPFAKISHERLRWLSDHIEEIKIAAGDKLFQQGDSGNKCYLVRRGRIEITTHDEKNPERSLAILKPPALFGEATLITHMPRNATATAVEDSELFVLSHELLSELIESEEDVAQMFMKLMIDRSLPLQNPHVSDHERRSAEGEILTILKNPDNGAYFQLSEEGAFIWKQLDGHHTLQDITLDLAKKYNLFAPDMVVALISKLTKSGFITNLTIEDEHVKKHESFIMKIIRYARKILDRRVAFGDADRRISYLYSHFVRYLFSKIGQILLALITILGFGIFVWLTPNVLLFFSFKHASLFLLFGLIPLSILSVFLHELGHAFAVKAFGYEVHYMGVGWYWLSPIAFTDTSDMWLATRKPRMLVNIAGIYVDVILAGISSIFLLIAYNHYVQCMLWLFALYGYIHALRMLSPLQDMDGYYILMDWVEKNHLRQQSVIWLVKSFPKALRNPKLFREHWPEVSYWLASLIFLACVTAVTLLLQSFIFDIFGVQSVNPYLALILPFLVVIISSLSVIAKIRNQTGE